MPDHLDWLPADGAHLTRSELDRISFTDLRALISGTEAAEPNRAYAVDIAVALSQALP